MAKLRPAQLARRAELERLWRAANPEKVRERRRQWAARHPERKKEKDRKYYAANAELLREKARRRYPSDLLRQRRNKLRKYGLTIESYNALLATQRGGCAVCHKEGKTKRLAVDHCHTTGVVRGLLCSACNTMIGQCFDSPEVLRALLLYVEKHSQLRLP